MADFFALDYYQLLNIERDASLEEINDAYRRVRREEYPDSSKHPDANARFRHVQDAYRTLSNPRKRRDYDNELTQRNPAPQPSSSRNEGSSETTARQGQGSDGQRQGPSQRASGPERREPSSQPRSSSARTGPAGTGAAPASPRTGGRPQPSDGPRGAESEPGSSGSTRGWGATSTAQGRPEQAENSSPQTHAQGAPVPQSSGARPASTEATSWPGTVGTQQGASGTGAPEVSSGQGQEEEAEGGNAASSEQAQLEPERAAVGALRFVLRLAALLFAVTAIAVGIIGSLAGAVPSWGPLSFTIFPAIAMLGGVLLITMLPVPNTGSIIMLIPSAMIGYLFATGYLDEPYVIYSFGSDTGDDTGLRGLVAFPAVVIDAQLDAATHRYGAIPAICVGIIIGGFWRMGMERQARDETDSQSPVLHQRLLSLAETRDTAFASFGWSILTAPVSYAVLHTAALLLFMIFIGIPFLIVDIFADIALDPVLDGDAWNLWIVTVSGVAAYACGRASGTLPSLLNQLLRRMVRNGERRRDRVASASFMAIALAPSALIFALIALGGLYWEPVLEPLVEWAFS